VVDAVDFRNPCRPGTRSVLMKSIRFIGQSFRQSQLLITMIPLHRSIPGMTAGGFLALLTGCASNHSFAKLDTNQDGSASPVEFEIHMKKAVFSRIDTDNDGKVTKVEWRQFNPAVSDAKFSKTDTNRDNSISTTEADAAFDREGSLKKLFTAMDTDKSGGLSSAEVSDFHSKVQQQTGPSPAEKVTQAATQP
jgi:Ca2+-binding EF-hand superfamily protein